MSLAIKVWKVFDILVFHIKRDMGSSVEFGTNPNNSTLQSTRYFTEMPDLEQRQVSYFYLFHLSKRDTECFSDLVVDQCDFQQTCLD